MAQAGHPRERQQGGVAVTTETLVAPEIDVDRVAVDTVSP